MMNWPMTRSLLLLQLQILPRIGVAGRDRREDVLPLLGREERAERVEEGMREHGHQVVVLENPFLDRPRQLLPLGGVDRFLVLLELGVEVLHAAPVARADPAALKEGLVPERPA